MDFMLLNRHCCSILSYFINVIIIYILLRFENLYLGFEKKKKRKEFPYSRLKSLSSLLVCFAPEKQAFCHQRFMETEKFSNH